MVIQLSDLKITAALLIFLLTLGAGFLPSLVKNSLKFLKLGDAFASGIFISAALLHLLPEACHDLDTIWGSNPYPVAALICLITFVSLLLMECKMGSCCQTHEYGKNHAAPKLLVILLTIHALIEGAAIGINLNFIGTSMLIFAILAHKASESFALASSLQHQNLTTKTIRWVIGAFSLVTPLGIFLASLIMQFLATKVGQGLGSFCNAVTAGTFLYLGSEYLLANQNFKQNPREIAGLILGILVMSLVALWG